jgi:hypothetical protein
MAEVGINYHSVQLVDVEASKKFDGALVLGSDSWEEAKSSEVDGNIPILSFKNVTVKTTNPVYKSIKSVDQEFLQNRLGFETGGESLIKEVSVQIKGGLWGKLELRSYC